MQWNRVSHSGHFRRHIEESRVEQSDILLKEVTASNICLHSAISHWLYAESTTTERAHCRRSVTGWMIEGILVEPITRYLGPGALALFTKLPERFWAGRISRELATHTNDGDRHVTARMLGQRLECICIIARKGWIGEIHVQAMLDTGRYLVFEIEPRVLELLVHSSGSRLTEKSQLLSKAFH